MPIPLNLDHEDGGTPAREVVLSYLRNWIVEGILTPGEIISRWLCTTGFSTPSGLVMPRLRRN